VTRLYRWLLVLYPASFRREYGAEMTTIFEQQFAETRGWFATVRLVAGVFYDVITNAAGVHVEILRQDLRYAARSLGHARGFALTAIVVTALGVGTNTAAFSVADFVLLKPLPFPDAGALVRLCEGPRTGGGWGCMNQLSPANFRDVRASATAFESMGAFFGGSGVLLGAGDPLRTPVASVTPEVLPLLGVAPLIGRVFGDPARDGREANTVVMGHALWQSRFGGDPAVVGRTINLDGTPRVVIGVMPDTFYFPTRVVQLWAPLVLREDDFADRNNSYLDAVGRLQSGTTFEQARAELTVIFGRLARDFPDTNSETGFSFFRQRDQMSPRTRLMLIVLCGASLSMLVLTCASLAHLLLARAASRERELAVRAALGAGRERLTRQLLTESAVLALIGGAAGMVVALLTIPLLTSLIPTTLPIAGSPTLDFRVLGFAGLSTALTAVGVGLIPALRSGGHQLFAALREGTRSAGGHRARVRQVLVTIEVAVSVGLLVCSGLLIRAVLRVQAVDPGFSPDAVLSLRSELPLPKYADAARRTEFYRVVLAEIRALPGVSAAAYTSGLPMVLTGGVAGVEVPGREVRRDGSDNVSVRWVSSQFFDALRIPLRAGRTLDDTDAADRALVATVSESFAARHWPGRDPIGLRFRVRNQDRTIVGVVGEIKVRGLERSSEPQVYLPLAQVPDGFGGLYHPKDLVVRAEQGREALVPAVRRIIHAADPDLPITNVRMLSEVVAEETATRRDQVNVLAALAMTALLLAGVGIYGLLGYTVSQRSREIGVRMALGARPIEVARLVLRESLIMAVVGIAIGLGAAYLAALAWSTLLFGVSPSDPLTLMTAAALGMAITLTGSVVPAWRAVRVSPLSAMRAD
jgi:predicted permease